MVTKGKYRRKRSWLPSFGSKKPPKAPAEPDRTKHEAPAEPLPQKPLPGTPPAETQEPPLTPGQKAWETTKSILAYLVMALSIAMMIFTAISVRSFDQYDRDIFGYKFFIVRSDSMSATDFSAGDLVVIQEMDPGLLAAGDIISFRSEDPASLGEVFTHKIRQATTTEDGAPAFVTYGTTTNTDDLFPVTFPNVLGKYQFSIPNVGTFFAFMKTPMGYVCCIGIPFLLMLLIQGGGMITSVRQLYHEKEEAAEAAHQEELAVQQKVIDSQRMAIRKLFLDMKALQERVEALERERD